MSSALPLFGRKFELQVSTPPDDSGKTQEIITIADSDLGDAGLHVRFDVYTASFQVFWYADVEIYNLDKMTTEKLLTLSNSQSPIKQGMRVSIAAGLGDNGYGVIFEGPVFQALWDRENGVDFKLTLHCILGLDEITFNNISSVYAVPVSQSEIIKRIVEQSFNKIPVEQITDKLSTKQLPRGKVLFGSPAKYFNEIARDNNKQWWIGRNGLSIGGALEVSSDPAIVYTPQTGIIGTPVQTQDGVNFRILLDPRIKARQPAMTVKIDNSTIILQKLQIGERPGILDQSGIYSVAGVRYYGDTRGNDWYCDITGYSSVGRLPFVQALY